MDAYFNGPPEQMPAQVSHASAQFLQPPSLPGTIPLGLQALYDHCTHVYPTQSNPLQVTAVLKYWYGLMFKICECMQQVTYATIK